MSHHNVSTSLPELYLDNNATTQVLPQAAKAALTTMQTQFGNPSSSHITGLQAKSVMDEARKLAKLTIGASTGDVIFTSGATEGIQTAIISALCAAKKSMVAGKEYCLLYGATEHKAVPESLKHWNELLEVNAQIKAIPVDHTGALDMEFIANEVPNALMICTMAVNNETGVFQDISQLDNTIRQHNPDVFWMVDCVQALGKMNLKISQTTIDYAPFSGHKLYAPKGIGFAYIKHGAPFTPFIAGGGQESGLRSGTENLPGMAALSVIFKMLLGQSEDKFVSVEQQYGFRQQLVDALTQAFPTVVFNHQFENSVPTTLNFSIPGFSSKEIMDLFDAANIRVSSGSACSSKVTRSFVLDAMGHEAWQSESAIRLSFGPAMSQDEINMACQRVALCAKALGHSCLMTDNGVDAAALDGLVQFKVGGSCSWLLVDKASSSAVIIDPLPELVERFNTLLGCQGLTLLAVLDTHGHADHESCRTELATRFLPQQTSDYLGWPVEMPSVTVAGQTYQYIALGQQWLVKLATPGHTQDSISFLACKPVVDGDNVLTVNYGFCGDTILLGSLGRTNFDTSCADAMFDSLQLLYRVVGANTLICASHDYNNEFTTTIGAEMTRNPLLAQVLTRCITREEFVADKATLDAHIVDQSGSEIVCGAFVGQCDGQMVKEYANDTLTGAMTSDTPARVIDIREPHEYELGHDERFDCNVPLTRLVQFIQEQQHDKEQPLILVCRSGSRSHIAAKAMARLGFNNVGHIHGGYAQVQCAG